MKKLSVSLAIFALVILFSWDKTEAEPLKSIKTDFLSALPEVKKHTLNNGVNLLYLKDDLPVTVIYASISFGKLYENSGNAGITEVLCKTLTIAGTESYPGNSLNQKLESVGGEINISAGWETIGIEIKVLSKYNNLAFDILGDLLKNPVFEGADVNSAKQLVMEKIKRDMDEPEETGVLN